MLERVVQGDGFSVSFVVVLVHGDGFGVSFVVIKASWCNKQPNPVYHLKYGILFHLVFT